MWTAVTVTVGFMVAAAWLGTGGWAGEPSGCIEAGDCYCEAFTNGLIAQPANTLSNLAFVAVGLWVLAQVRPRHRGTGLMATHPGIATLYGWIAIGLGLGSMLFHGTMTEWGGWADLVSMYLFITFFFLYELRILLGRPARWLVAWWIGGNAVLAGFQWLADNGIGKLVFAALIVLTLATNRRVVRTGRVLRDERFFWAGLGTYLAGNIVWTLSRTGAPWCDPDTALQGHALWHITSAAAVGLFYCYLRSEDVGHDPWREAAGTGHSTGTVGA